MSSPMEDVVEGAEEQQITVRVQTSHDNPIIAPIGEASSGGNIIEVRVPAKCPVFHVSLEVSKALRLSDLPELTFQGVKLEADATIDELGITDGSLVTTRVNHKPHNPVGIIAPGPAMAEGAESAAMSCVDSLALDADAPVGSPTSGSSDFRVTTALRELIKQLVSAKTAPDQVNGLVQISEDVERLERDAQEHRQQMALVQSTIREQSRLQAQLVRQAGMSDGDADMWPAHQAMGRGYPGLGPADELQQTLRAAYILQAMRAQQAQQEEEEEQSRSFLMKKGDVELSEAHRQAQLPGKVAGSVTGSGVLSSGHMTKEEMDRARRAHAEQMQSEQGKKQREQQEAEQKSRSREAMFNSPFAGASKMLGKH